MPGRQMDTHLVEIVRVRLADMNDAEKVRLVFNEFIAGRLTGGPAPAKAALYKSGYVPTDWSIHLIWAGNNHESTASSSGTFLSSLLRELGLVNHSTWVRDS